MCTYVCVCFLSENELFRRTLSLRFSLPETAICWHLLLYGREEISLFLSLRAVLPVERNGNTPQIRDTAPAHFNTHIDISWHCHSGSVHPVPGYFKSTEMAKTPVPPRLGCLAISLHRLGSCRLCKVFLISDVEQRTREKLFVSALQLPYYSNMSLRSLCVEGSNVKYIRLKVTTLSSCCCLSCFPHCHNVLYESVVYFFTAATSRRSAGTVQSRQLVCFAQCVCRQVFFCKPRGAKKPNRWICLWRK